MFKRVEERLSVLSQDIEDITTVQSPRDKKYNILKDKYNR